jgi:hypothetical protein
LEDGSQSDAAEIIQAPVLQDRTSVPNDAR